MWESPITQYFGEMHTQMEGECMKIVQQYGFDVNKEELSKALMYDRQQHEKGYEDGYNKAIDKFAEMLKEKYEEYPLDMCLRQNDYYSYSNSCIQLENYIDTIAEQLKGGVE